MNKSSTRNDNMSFHLVLLSFHIWSMLHIWMCVCVCMYYEHNNRCINTVRKYFSTHTHIHTHKCMCVRIYIYIYIYIWPLPIIWRYFLYDWRSINTTGLASNVNETWTLKFNGLIIRFCTCLWIVCYDFVFFLNDVIKQEDC